MSRYDWEEVKRLAADFQKAQADSTLQRLSERNCIEIITKLIELKLLDVVFTNDGKSYITPKHLVKEIQDELYVHGGRVNLIDVAKSLNVDLNVVKSLAQDIIKHDPSIRIILGQLIDDTYLKHVAEEINERLQQQGILTVNDLTRMFDLSGDTIHMIIKENMGKIIVGVRQDKQDTGTYFTDVYFNRIRATVKGAFLAITKPTLISTIVNQCKISERLLFTAVDGFLESKQIPGVLTERSCNVCTYIPHIHIKAQSDWAKNFYKQNSYLEYESLKKAGINDPRSFIDQLLPQNENYLHLSNCVIGTDLLNQVLGALEDAIATRQFVNITSYLPSSLSTENSEFILQKVIQEHSELSTIHVFTRVYAFSELFLSDLQNRFECEIVQDLLKTIMSDGRYESYLNEHKYRKLDTGDDDRELTRKEERKKRANTGKSGGGLQGRETKTRSTKKKGGKKEIRRDDSEEEEGHEAAHSFEVVDLQTLRSFIENDISVEVDDEELFDDIAHYLHPLVNQKALKVLQAHLLEQQMSCMETKRKSNHELQDNMIRMYEDLKLYLKGIQEFPAEETRLQLSKYLLKIVGTQFANLCFTFVSDKNDEVINTEGRQVVISRLDNKQLKNVLNKLNKLLTGNSVEDFIVSIENVFDELNIMTKKMDKKKEKLKLEHYKTALLTELKQTDNPAIVLHFAVLILFQDITRTMLQASGKFVATILDFLKTRLQEECIQILKEYHDSVIKLLKSTEDDPEYLSAMNILQEKTPLIKDLAINFKI